MVKEAGLKVVAIIQARMRSERLPGKVLMDIEGKPMLWHVCDRVSKSELIEKIVVATSTGEQDDAVEEFCRKNGIDFYRGSEEDVLDRFYQAARQHGADVVVRICADSPLLDPRVLDKLVGEYLKDKNSLEGVFTNIRRTFPIGICGEVVPFGILETVWTEAQEDHHRESVTAYLREHPEKFRMRNVEYDRDLSYLRWTVDEELDMKFAREVYKRLYAADKVFLMEDILRILEEEPHLKEINTHIKQKRVKE